MQIRKVPPELLLEQYRELLRQGQTELPLVITGSSMCPFLVGNRDTVFLSPLHQLPRRGQIVLYLRDNGQYVLHRVYRAGKDGCDMVGDGQTQIERGIRQEQMIALVHRVSRKGRLLQKGSFLWWLFEKPWLCIRPLRPAALRLYTLLRRP